MSLEVLAVAILAALVGALWCFFGFKFFLILLPVWGFFTGFFAGAQGVTMLFGDAFLATITGWAVGIVLGLVLAVLSYLYYWVAIVLLGGTIGYILGTGLMQTLGFEADFLVLLVGIVVGVLFAIGTVVLRAPKYLVIVLTAFGGSAAIVAGVLLLLGQIELSDATYGVVGASLDYISENVLWAMIWALIGGAGLVFQVMTTPTLEEVERTDYRYA